MLASNFIKPDITVHLQSENGILGLVRRLQRAFSPLRFQCFESQLSRQVAYFLTVVLSSSKRF